MLTKQYWKKHNTYAKLGFDNFFVDDQFEKNLNDIKFTIFKIFFLYTDQSINKI